MDMEVASVAGVQGDCNRFLSPDGRPVRRLPRFAEDPAVLVTLYRALVLTRIFDSKAMALQRTGMLGTFASSLGQEAIGVGIASAMRSEDVLLPYYRDHGAQILRGVTMQEILLYWGGDERGSDYSAARRDFPICVPIGTQISQAVGVAYAMKLRREPRVAVCLLGDGATSKGDFYESLNMAGAWRLPLLFVINNNQWAISVPVYAQTAAASLAQKAIAAGIEGCRVDGNDVIAVRAAIDAALVALREGRGPRLIEAVTYRLGDHTTADDATRYRAAEEVDRQWRFEPVARLRNYLAGIGEWTREREEELVQQCTREVNAAVEAYLAAPPPTPEQMFDHLYATLPAALEPQRRAALQSAEGEHERGK
jgi:2-oxoisovalerate dehydrogenase E1 component alpha subunit